MNESEILEKIKEIPIEKWQIPKQSKESPPEYFQIKLNPRFLLTVREDKIKIGVNRIVFEGKDASTVYSHLLMQYTDRLLLKQEEERLENIEDLAYYLENFK